MTKLKKKNTDNKPKADKTKSSFFTIKSFKKQSILKYLIEVLIVAFGVFLGIIVSEYRSELNTQKNVAKSIKLIIDELESNSLSLENAIEYHQKIKAGFDSISRFIPMDMANNQYFGNEVFRHDRIPHWNGPGIYPIEDISFESAKMGGVFQEMEMEKIKLISGIYKQLYAYSDFGESVTNRIMSMNSDTKVLDVIGTIEMLSNEVLSNEKFLKLEIDKTIKILKDKK